MSRPAASCPDVSKSSGGEWKQLRMVVEDPKEIVLLDSSYKFTANFIDVVFVA
jgi:hypothetical protein